ncbi:2-dehydro-3-deoxyphosphooctonate aldolase (KDO 8-P synthase) [Novosphingobium kunmingense]|uniref:2-dehydro-3-deoxyphosphooctonate aldolase n=2 Tax=Novosphingobium kunmingense TaxID=1211806 RepID=A0A2N0HJ93_9SPHN|nr:2-dehydro-3-deoxyphosphooctonate aldolase (KDO 8-P synthase) [Novosphingobium kunmingense]
MLVIAGPCVIEGESHALAVAERLADIAERLGLRLIYKSSFDKANRTSAASPRGPGLDEGLAILDKVRRETGLPVLTDIHESTQAVPVAEVVDVLQIPAFLARQTDLIQTAVATGRTVNVKKGQFMAPEDMAHVVAKAQAVLPAGANVGERLWLCERGTSFGYRDLVVDMRGLEVMRDFGCPVIFDAGHSAQQPAAAGHASGGRRDLIPALARAAVAVGVDGLFLETHPDPGQAHSDAATAWPLDRFEALMTGLIALDRASRDARTAVLS